jgi:hypothetical protein
MGVRSQKCIMVLSTDLLGLRLLYSLIAGLELARLADLPLDALVEAERVAVRLAELESERCVASKGNKIALRRKAMLTVLLALISSALSLDGYLCNNYLLPDPHTAEANP